jgi:predicted acetyltransferase
VHPENAASQRVIEKCGLTLEDRKVYFGTEMCRYWIEYREFARIVEGDSKG